MGDEHLVVRNATLTGYRRTAFTAGPGTRTRLIGALVLGSAVLVWAAERAPRHGTDHAWFLAVSLSGLFVARGLHLRRPVTLPHLAAAMMVLVVANFSYRAHHPALGFVFLAATGFVLMLPQPSRPPGIALSIPAQIPRFQRSALRTPALA